MVKSTTDHPPAALLSPASHRTDQALTQAQTLAEQQAQLAHLRQVLAQIQASPFPAQVAQLTRERDQAQTLAAERAARLQALETQLAAAHQEHAAAHPPDATAWQLAQHPYASLYLLRQYLQMHPRLKAALKKTLEGRASRMTWNPTTIQHRMQVVLDVFLRYHGLCRSAGLGVYPVSAWNRPDGSGDFQVAAELHPEVLMGERDGVVPLRDAVQAAERALAWVLYALFAYSEEVGLELKQGSAPFW